VDERLLIEVRVDTAAPPGDLTKALAALLLERARKKCEALPAAPSELEAAGTNSNGTQPNGTRQL
jgi:hypothetical protein